jgi:hypothetical protein
MPGGGGPPPVPPPPPPPVLCGMRPCLCAVQRSGPAGDPRASSGMRPSLKGVPWNPRLLARGHIRLIRAWGLGEDSPGRPAPLATLGAQQWPAAADAAPVPPPAHPRTHPSHSTPYRTPHSLPLHAPARLAQAASVGRKYPHCCHGAPPPPHGPRRRGAAGCCPAARTARSRRAPALRLPSPPSLRCLHTPCVC